MSDEEAQTSWVDLNNHVSAQSAQAFVTTFLSRCLRASAHIDYYSREEDGKDVLNLKENLGRVMGKWKHSAKRLILIDWEDTLVEKAKGAGKTNEVGEEEEKAMELLKKLNESKKNEVWVLSGMPTKNGAMERLAAAVEGVGIV